MRPELVSWLAVLDPPLDPERTNPEVPRVFELRHAPPGELERYLQERNPGGGALLAQALAQLFRQAADAPFEAMLKPRRSEDVPAPNVPCLVAASRSCAGRTVG